MAAVDRHKSRYRERDGVEIEIIRNFYNNFEHMCSCGCMNNFLALFCGTDGVLDLLLLTVQMGSRGFRTSRKKNTTFFLFKVFPDF